ncbi:hypothetical protein GGG16DRAFT_66872 [Schizophyllum commune]
MNADTSLTGAALTSAFIVHSDETRYNIVRHHLDDLLRFVSEERESGGGLSLIVATVAAAMYARYAVDVGNLVALFCEADGVQLPSDVQGIVDLYPETAERAGYPTEAANRLFDEFVPDRQSVFEHFALRKPLEELSCQPSAPGTLNMLMLHAWQNETFAGTTLPERPHVVRIPVPLYGSQ